MAKQRRRILHKIRLDEISAVDRPAQEFARVTIMKRNGDNMDTELEDEVAILEKMVETTLSEMEASKAAPADQPDFDRLTSTQAMAKARRDHPDAFAKYQGDTHAKANDYDDLVAVEIAKGC